MREAARALGWPLEARWGPLVTLLAVAAVAATAIGCGGEEPNPPVEVDPAFGAQPNIVFVLTDDLSWDLVRHMPNVRRLQHQGMTFRQFLVSDSLCCSSRATILTGEFPHNTHVLGNTLPDGGYPAFRKHGARWRMRFHYVHDGPVLLGTGGAIRRALPQLGDAFFVMYGDSYLECDFAAVEQLGRALRLEFAGPLGAAERQRARNFLIEHLR